MSLSKNKNNWSKILMFTTLNMAVVIVLFWLFFTYPSISNINKIEITKIENGTIHTSSSVLINNPNFFSINGKNLTFRMKYGNTTVGNGEMKNQFTLPSNKKTLLTAKMEFNLKKLSKFWRDFIKKDSLEIDILSNGSYTFLNLSIEHEEKMYLSSSDLLNVLIADAFDNESIKYMNLSIKKMGLTNWIWNFDFQIKNTLPDDITLSNLSVKLYADEKTKKALGVWNTNKKNIVLAENESTTLKGSLKISFGGLMKTILTKAKTKTKTLYVKTEIVVKLNNEKFSIPYSNSVLFNPITKEIEIID